LFKAPVATDALSVSAKADEPGDRRSVCGGVEDALAYSGRFGLDSSRPLTVQVVADLQYETGENTVGFFNGEDRAILALSFRHGD
jgi:hypothetical protein